MSINQSSFHLHTSFIPPRPHSSSIVEPDTMANLVVRSNDALQANPDIFHYPVTSDINITSHGSDWYWAVCAVMIVSTFAFVGLASRIERRNRIFHYITASITMVAAIAYFTLGSNLGYAATIVEFQRSNPKVAGTYREIFYVRYIDWVVTTPVSSPVLTCLQLLTTSASTPGPDAHRWTSYTNHFVYTPR